MQRLIKNLLFARFLEESKERNPIIGGKMVIKFFKIIIIALVFLVLLKREASFWEVLASAVFVLVIWKVRFFNKDY